MGIDTFLTTFFWLYLIVIIIRATLLSSEHPRTRIINVGEDTLSLIMSIAIFSWICYLKFSGQ